MVSALLADHGSLAAEACGSEAPGGRPSSRRPTVTLMQEGDTLSVVDGVDRAGIVAELEVDALSISSRTDSRRWAWR